MSPIKFIKCEILHKNVIDPRVTNVLLLFVNKANTIKDWFKVAISKFRGCANVA